MDLGCLDMGCITLSDKQSSNDTTAQSEGRDSEGRESSSGASNAGKNKASKETAQSNGLNKFTSQIKKSSHRKSSSPLNWFPRKKVDSYLKRKIKLLQEVDGMNSTLDETLGASNPHYCRVEREKMAAREAAQKAMEARKAAMVEASWCRILRAARIESKEAETLLLKEEENVAELFEAATSMGVLMYDNPDCPRKSYEIETSSSNGGASTTHTVRASFETAFEVDKEVAAAVKTAFIRLTNCPSFNKEEFRDLLRKINQNPDDGKIYHDVSAVSSESEFESENQKPGLNSNGNTSPTEKLQKKCKKRHSTNKFSMENLVDMMIERLKCLKEEELASLATIVATCGLNAALSEVENSKQCNSALNCVPPGGSGLPSLDKFLIKNISKLERKVEEAKKSENGEDLIMYSDEKVEVENSFPDSGNVIVKNYTKFENEIKGGEKGRNGESYEIGGKKLGRIEQELPSLEKFLVKHMSRLEREVQEAKDRRENATSSSLEGNLAGKENIDLNKNVEIRSKLEQEDSTNFSKQDSDNESKEMENSLENILVTAHCLGKGKLKEGNSESYQMCGKKLGRIEEDLPSLDNFLVKHLSKLEREVEEAKTRREIVTSSCLDGNTVGKVNIDLKTNVDRRSKLEVEESTNLSKQDGNYESREMENSLGNVLVKPLHRLEREKMLKKRGENSSVECESLDKVLVKHLSRLEKEKLASESLDIVKKKDLKEDKDQKQDGNYESRGMENSLGNVLVKPLHHLEREKMLKKRGENSSVECESLDTVLVKHLSRLEKEKLASESLDIVKKKDLKEDTQERNEGGLDQVLVKHKCRLEKEKLAASLQSEDEIKHTTTSRREVREKELQEAWGGLSLGNYMQPHLSSKLATSLQSEDEIKHTTNSRRELREKELQEAWGGLSLGNSMRPHLSRLQRDKAAWLKAEEEERRRGHEEAALK